MRRLTIMLVAAVVAGCATPSVDTVALATLNGDWIVDLSTDPAEPYTRPMHLTLNDDGSVSGSFYESTIEAGRWKADRGRTCVSFRTSDGVGPYHSAACLVGDHVEGQTLAEHRSFLFNWNATRGAED